MDSLYHFYQYIHSLFHLNYYKLENNINIKLKKNFEMIQYRLPDKAFSNISDSCTTPP